MYKYLLKVSTSATKFSQETQSYSKTLRMILEFI
jgi:hypothetical protein